MDEAELASAQQGDTPCDREGEQGIPKQHLWDSGELGEETCRPGEGREGYVQHAYGQVTHICYEASCERRGVWVIYRRRSREVLRFRVQDRDLGRAPRRRRGRHCASRICDDDDVARPHCSERSLTVRLLAFEHDLRVGYDDDDPRGCAWRW